MGDDVSLVCEAFINLTSNITWTFNDKIIIHSSNSLILENYSSDMGIARKTSRLRLFGVQCLQSGQYSCSVSSDSTSTVLSVTGKDHFSTKFLVV